MCGFTVQKNGITPSCTALPSCLNDDFDVLCFLRAGLFTPMINRQISLSAINSLVETAKEKAYLAKRRTKEFPHIKTRKQPRSWTLVQILAVKRRESGSQEAEEWKDREESEFRRKGKKNRWGQDEMEQWKKKESGSVVSDKGWRKEEYLCVCVLISSPISVKAEDKLTIWIRADGGQVVLRTS